MAKYPVTGANVWACRFGGTSDDIAYGIAADGSGNVVVVGQFQGTVEFGGAHERGRAGHFRREVYAAADGSFLGRGYGSTGAGVAYAVAVDTSGNVLVIGGFTGAVNFGGTSDTGTRGLDTFIVKLHGSSRLRKSAL